MMKDKIIVGVVMLVIGTVLGHYMKSYLEAGLPHLEISSVQIEAFEFDRDTEIPIPPRIVELAASSNWIGGLSDTESFGALVGARDSVRSSLKALRTLATELPALEDLLDQERPDTENHQAWRQAREAYLYANRATIDTLIASLIGEANAGRLQVSIGDLKEVEEGADHPLRLLPDHTMYSELHSFFSGDLADNAQFARRALAHVGRITESEIENDSELLEELNVLIASEDLGPDRRSSLVVDAVVSNNGRSNITLDDSLGVQITGLQKTILLRRESVDDGNAGPIVVSAGSSRFVRFRQTGYLSVEEHNILANMTLSEAFEVIGASKILAGDARNLSFARTGPVQLREGISNKREEYERAVASIEAPRSSTIADE